MGVTRLFSAIDKERRIARWEVSIDALLNFMQHLDGSRLIKVEGLPVDAHCIAIDDSPSRMGGQQITFYLQSDSFEPAEEGAYPPLLNVTDTQLPLAAEAVARG